MKSKADYAYEKGVRFTEGGLFYNASAEFKQALKIDKKLVLKKLEEYYLDVSRSEDFDKALAVGNILFAEKKNDSKLSNTLGNFSRKIDDATRAQHFYKTALKISPNFPYPKYNLVAMAAGVPYYDDEALEAAHFLGEETLFILPGYLVEEQDPSSQKTFYEDKNYTTWLMEETKRIGEAPVVEELEKTNLEYAETEESLKGSLANPLERDNLLTKKIELKKKQRELESKLFLATFDALLLQAGSNELTVSLLYYNKARFCIEYGEYTLAIKALTAVEQKAILPYYRLFYIVALGLVGNTEDAIKLLKNISSKDGDNRYYNVNLALLYRKLGNVYLSCKYFIYTHYLLSLSEQIYDKDEFLQLADKAFREHDKEKIRKYYGTIVKEKNSTFEVNYNYARFLYKEDKDFAKASKLLKPVCISENPFQSKAKNFLGSIQQDLLEKADTFIAENNSQQAREFFQNAITVEKSHSTIQRILSSMQKIKNQTEEDKEYIALLNSEFTNNNNNDDD